MPEKPKVYLDHLIQRESLRYRRKEEQFRTDTEREQHDKLPIRDLLPNETWSRISLLRKPDFQRATWAWTPEDCVSLLESLVNSQVIPSIIMWTDQSHGLDYILDGGHRVSVVLAWLLDDWGDKPATRNQKDAEDEDRILTAAREVRRLVDARVGRAADYKQAEKKLDQLLQQGAKDLSAELGEREYQRALFYQRLLKGYVGFHILWAAGDYERAEQSFLKINKSGRQLTDWEKRLVENRNSSLARLVMSLTSISSAGHYWPSDKTLGLDDSDLASVQAIQEGIQVLNEFLFKPDYVVPITRLEQPLFAIPDTEKKPYYLAEFFTVIEGGKGHDAETEKLLRQDRTASPREIIHNGLTYIQSAIDACEHLLGNPSLSLGIVPALYFYTEAGRPVRSLLYGFLYWLLAGTEEDIRNRKLVFTVHRAAFEYILQENKEDVVGGITRKTGSGPEVTFPTAQYFNGLLDLLVKHNSQIDSSDFAEAYAELTARLTNNKKPLALVVESNSPTFSVKQKASKVLEVYFQRSPRCELCGGMLDPDAGAQHDHIRERHKGGLTVKNNQRLLHPFCNHKRKILEAELKGPRQLRLPDFYNLEVAPGIKQLPLALKFPDDERFLSPYLEEGTEEPD